MVKPAYLVWRFSGEGSERGVAGGCLADDSRAVRDLGHTIVVLQYGYHTSAMSLVLHCAL